MIAAHSSINSAARMQHFEAMTAEEKQRTIRSMANDGHTDHGIAHATALSVEMVRTVLGERKAGH